MKTTTPLKCLSMLVLAAAAGCALDEEPVAVGDEVDEVELDTPGDTPIDEPTELDEAIITDDGALDDEDLDIAPAGTQTIADTIGPAYHLFTKRGATCRDHCVSKDEYLFSYGVRFSRPFYHYNNSKIYADYYVGQSRKQKWEQHRFAKANVDVFCGSSGQYLYKYYGRAKRGREVVRTWLCYAGRCQFQGDNVMDFHKGWKH